LIAAVGIVAALTPIVAPFNGPIAGIVHVTGGTLALFALIVEGRRLPGRQMVLAAAGVIISAVVISIVTAGEGIGTIVQIVVLVVLASIYWAVVFRSPRTET
jgi:hypothetical protein